MKIFTFVFRNDERISYSIIDFCLQSPQVDSRSLLTIDNSGHLQGGMISGTAGMLGMPVMSRELFGANQTVIVDVEVSLRCVSYFAVEPFMFLKQNVLLCCNVT